MPTITDTEAPVQRVLDVILETFNEDPDGYLYPMDPGEPLVRVQATSGGWCVERRRNPGTPWMPIATGKVAEFDPASFRAWRAGFPLIS